MTPAATPNVIPLGAGPTLQQTVAYAFSIGRLEIMAVLVLFHPDVARFWFRRQRGRKA